MQLILLNTADSKLISKVFDLENGTLGETLTSGAGESLTNSKIDDIGNIYDKKHFLKNKFKLKMLEKIFPNTGMLNPIEFIDMERMHFALNSFIYLIQFV